MEKQNAWHTLKRSDVLKLTSQKNGLSQDEVREAQSTYGLNRLDEEESEPLWKKLLNQFKNSMILILIAAALISFAMGEHIDALIILSIVLLNALLGLIQEDKATKALSALKEMSAPNAKVIREGKLTVIPAYEVVPFDILVLEAGDVVAADVRLLETISAQIQEASLTGESLPVEKDATVTLKHEAALADRVNMAYASSMVTYGRATGLVVATGMKTEVGKIAQLLSQTQSDPTPLQKQLDDLGRFLGYAALVAVLLIFGVGVFYGHDVFDVFLTSVSLAVAVIPESLPAVATIVLAMGVQRLAKRNAIIRNLASVETLGMATVICSDKTGTLTQNKMTVMDAWGSDPKRLALAVSLCNDAQWVENQWVGDPTETALQEWAMKQEVKHLYKRLGERPFDSTRKRMSTLNQLEDSAYVFIKGGVDEVLSICTHYCDETGPHPLSREYTASIQQANLDMGYKALRVLAVAEKKWTQSTLNLDAFEEHACFIGLVGMMDPARPEAKQAIKECKEAGIQVIMITGDHKTTATAIGQEIGLLEDHQAIFTGEELDRMSDDELASTVHSVGVFARVSPTHKIRIVDALKTLGEQVAMTGDGVNDAPALKKADIGAAMGKVGTEVAKGAADMVLADDNFATIVHAIEEGRRIKDNILKSISYLLSCNVGELLVLMVATFMNWATPLLPIHILWVNLVTDSLPALALGVDPAQPDLMNRAPRKETRLLSGSMNWRILYQGVMIGGLTLMGYLYGLGFFGQAGSVDLAQTMAFSVLALSQLVHAFNIRSFTHSIVKKSPVNRSLILATIVTALMMGLVLGVPILRDLFKLVPLDLNHSLVILGLSFLPIPIVEGFKALHWNGSY